MAIPLSMPNSDDIEDSRRLDLLLEQLLITLRQVLIHRRRTQAALSAMSYHTRHRYETLDRSRCESHPSQDEPSSSSSSHSDAEECEDSTHTRVADTDHATTATTTSTTTTSSPPPSPSLQLPLPDLVIDSSSSSSSSSSSASTATSVASRKEAVGGSPTCHHYHHLCHLHHRYNQHHHHHHDVWMDPSAELVRLAGQLLDQVRPSSSSCRVGASPRHRLS